MARAVRFPSSSKMFGTPPRVDESAAGCLQALHVNPNLASFLHAGPRTPFNIRRSRCGVTGSCVTAPGNPTASSMADAIAAPTPVMPLSPAP